MTRGGNVGGGSKLVRAMKCRQSKGLEVTAHCCKNGEYKLLSIMKKEIDFSPVLLAPCWMGRGKVLVKSGRISIGLWDEISHSDYFGG